MNNSFLHLYLPPYRVKNWNTKGERKQYYYSVIHSLFHICSSFSFSFPAITVPSTFIFIQPILFFTFSYSFYFHPCHPKPFMSFPAQILPHITFAPSNQSFTPIAAKSVSYQTSFSPNQLQCSPPVQLHHSEISLPSSKTWMPNRQPEGQMQSAEPWNLAHGAPQGVGNLAIGEGWPFIKLHSFFSNSQAPSPTQQTGLGCNPFPSEAGLGPGHASLPPPPRRARLCPTLSLQARLGSGHTLFPLFISGLGHAPSLSMRIGQAPFPPAGLCWGQSVFCPPLCSQIVPTMTAQALDWEHQLDLVHRQTRHCQSSPAHWAKKVEHHCSKTFHRYNCTLFLSNLPIKTHSPFPSVWNFFLSFYVDVAVFIISTWF